MTKSPSRSRMGEDDGQNGSADGGREVTSPRKSIVSAEGDAPTKRQTEAIDGGRKADRDKPERRCGASKCPWTLQPRGLRQLWAPPHATERGPGGPTRSASFVPSSLPLRPLPQ